MGATRNILVVGATGQQGSAVVKQLLNVPSVKILALTRNTDSPKAKSLAESNSGVVTLVEGDTTSPDGIFASQPKGSIDSVFLVTVPGKVPEDQQANPFIDAAIAHGVKHIVFSSVDRGGDERSWTNPTNVKHFYEKHNVELHLRDAAAKAGANKVTWTILRPVAFLDNMQPGNFCYFFTAMWASALTPERKLQLVGTHDIAVWAARSLADPEQYAGRAIGLAGDELTLSEAQEIFKRVTGKDLPQSWTFLGATMLWAITEVKRMFGFFEREGYGADIKKLNGEVQMQNFEAWLRSESRWRE